MTIVRLFPAATATPLSVEFTAAARAAGAVPAGTVRI
jgi:hypothetical protein